MSGGIATATTRCWELFDAGRRQGAETFGGGAMIDQAKLDGTRQRVRDHKLFMATADRSSPAELVCLMQQLGFLCASVPYLLDEIDRLRAERREPTR